MIHLDRPALYFPGLFWFTPLKQQSDSSVVNVLIHIIIKRPRGRQLQSVTGVLELKEVSNLTDDVQRLWRHLYNEEEKKKCCQSEGQHEERGRLQMQRHQPRKTKL